VVGDDEEGCEVKPADYWKQVREVCDKAPPGPWSQILDDNDRWLIEADNDEEVARRLNENNAAFIALARTALPEALDEIERLRTALEQIVDSSVASLEATELTAIARAALGKP
jgi:hypothetical protein